MSKNYSVEDILADIQIKKHKSAIQTEPIQVEQDFEPEPQNINDTQAFKPQNNVHHKNHKAKLPKQQENSEKNFIKSDIKLAFGENADFDFGEEEIPKKRFGRKKVKEQQNNENQNIEFKFNDNSNNLNSNNSNAQVNKRNEEIKQYVPKNERFKLNIDQNLFMDYESMAAEDKLKIESDKEVIEDTSDEKLNITQKDDDLAYENIKESSEDYCSPKDEGAVKADISKIKLLLNIRTIITLIIFAVSCYFTISYKNTTPLPDFMHPTGGTMRGFMIANSALALLTMLVNSNTVWSGILGFFTFKGDSDTLPSFALLATLIQGVAYSFVPTAFYPSKFDLFFPAAILLILFNNFGKMLLIKRIQNNFAVMTSKGKKYALMSVKSQNVENTINKTLGSPRDKIVYYCKTRWLSSFIELSYTEDPTDDLCKFISPICVIGSIAIAGITYFFTQNIFSAITALTVILCLCAPLSSTLVTNKPLYKMAKTLNKDEAVVTGYASIDDFSKTDTVIINAPDMFKPENVTLHGIKAFDQTQIENVITDAASVLVKCYGTLSEVFLQLINNDRSMLKKVDSVRYKDSMGLYAVVDGKEVLIGNRQLMIKNKIEVPSSEYENKYVKDSRNIVYLSNSGKLVAMFIISYRADEEFTAKLHDIIEEGIDLVVYTVDPNITAEKVADTIGIPRDYVTVMPSKIHGIYQKNTQVRQKIPAKIGFVGSIGGMLHTITASINIKHAISRGIFAQLAFLVLGYCVGTFLSFMGYLSAITFVHVIIFQVLSALVICICTNVRKI